MRLPMIAAVALLAAGTVTGAASPAAGAAKRTSITDWHGYHNTVTRSGYLSTMPTYTGGLHVTKKVPLDGAVYASPIIARARTIVATENNTVYAFDPANRLLWKRHLGTPSPQSQRPCGNIDPLGITGTPVYFSSTETVFVAAEFGGNPPTHRLYGLSVTTGRVTISRNLDLSGTDSRVMQQRGALTIAGGRVWVPFGGMTGDCGDYKGRLVGYAMDGEGPPVSFTVPTAREAGIWAPPGPTADSSGNLYVSVGNGASGTGDPYDYSDSVLKINNKGKRVDSFSPSSWASDNDSDLDLGSQGPAFAGYWVFIAGKSGTAYVLRHNDLGGIGGQVSSRSLCRSFGGTAVVGKTVYVPCTDGVRQVYIDFHGTMHVGWHAASSINGSPVVGGGRVWVLDPAAGRLHGLNTKTGASRASVSVGVTNRFATPALSGHRIMIGTLSGLTVLSY